MPIFIRPSGREITTNDHPSALDLAKRKGWKMKEEEKEEKPKRRRRTKAEIEADKAKEG